MWWVVSLLTFLCCLAGFCQPIRVATWNMQWFPSGSQNSGVPDIEQQRIKVAASLLKEIDPDVLLVQEIRDWKTCEDLAEALKPKSYHVLVCSMFKDRVGGIVGRQQVAILSKRPAWAAFAEKWKTFGTVDPPRGFAFAAISYGTNDVAFYSVHLKSNLTKQDARHGHQLNMLKRELAAEQLLDHCRELNTRLTNGIEAVVIAGDFNTNTDNPLFVSENTLGLLKRDGYLSGFESIPLLKRITCPGKGRYPDATFDYIYVRRLTAVGPPKILTADISDHCLVSRDLMFR